MTVNFDIQDVGGGFVYEFPGMRNVSLASADAFLLVFSLESAETWAEVEKLRDMVIEAKVNEISKCFLKWHFSYCVLQFSIDVKGKM